MEDKKKKEDKIKDANLISSLFGGLLGNAANKLKEDKRKKEEDIAAAMGEGRPSQSKKWTE